MNLHAIVRGAITSVNPDITVTVQTSLPYATTPAGKRVPAYAAPVTLTAQVQALTTTDLRKLDGLNIQGSMRKIYFPGTISAVSRFSQKGGDLVTLPDGTVYLTTAVLEQWPDWVAVAVTMQNGA